LRQAVPFVASLNPPRTLLYLLAPFMGHSPSVQKSAV
jgi:hypothetical protein